MPPIFQLRNGPMQPQPVMLTHTHLVSSEGKTIEIPWNIGLRHDHWKIPLLSFWAYGPGQRETYFPIEATPLMTGPNPELVGCNTEVQNPLRNPGKLGMHNATLNGIIITVCAQCTMQPKMTSSTSITWMHDATLTN